MESSIKYYLLSILIIIHHLCFCNYFNNPMVLIWIIYGLLPVLDEYLPRDEANPTKQEQHKMKNMLRYKIPLYLTLVLDWTSLIFSIKYVMTSNIGWLYNAGVIFAEITIQAASFNLAHEINHKNNFFEKLIGCLHLSKNHYMHFVIEHNHGHHKNVATFEDPATSRLNESLYKFFYRTITQSYISAWKIENNFCVENYGSAFSWRNKMIYFTVAFFLIPLSLYYLFGVKVMLLQLLIGYTSALFFETINYIEHYGLTRKKLENGKYENVNITHSWNAPHTISNYLLFKLQRHSDHHENSLKPYQNLCTYEKSPTLPNGYSFCLLLAYFPRLWFNIMNPIVEMYKNGLEVQSEEALKKIKKNTLFFLIWLNIISFGFFFAQVLMLSINQVKAIN